jgi:hypothetical protein
MTRSSCSGSAIALFVSCMAVACGGAAPAPAKAPSAPEAETTATDEPRTIEEAQDWITRARADLEGEPRATEASSSSKTADTPGEPQGGSLPAREERAPSPDAACGGSCRALASMKRAVEALCRMTGDADERCADARRTLSDSTARLARCKCDGG